MHVHQTIYKIFTKWLNDIFWQLKSVLTIQLVVIINTDLSCSINYNKSAPEQYSKITHRWFRVSYQLKNFKIFMWFKLWNIRSSFRTFFLLDFSKLLTATYSTDFFFRPFYTYNKYHWERTLYTVEYFPLPISS